MSKPDPSTHRGPAASETDRVASALATLRAAGVAPDQVRRRLRDHLLRALADEARHRP